MPGEDRPEHALAIGVTAGVGMFLVILAFDKDVFLAFGTGLAAGYLSFLVVGWQQRRYDRRADAAREARQEELRQRAERVERPE